MSWESVEDAGRDAVGWSMVADYAKHRYESARLFIANALGSGRGIDVEVGGRVVGSVSRGQAKDQPDVTDDIAFLAYVVDHHPEALRVDGNWKKLFLNRLVKVASDGPTQFVDKVTGEIVPGVELCRSTPYWRVTKDPEAREQMNALLSGVTPTLEGFKALPEPVSRWEQDETAGAIGGKP